MQNDPEAPTQAAPPRLDEQVRAHDSDRPRPDTFAPGHVIERYTILERVGRGGMGEVYAAYDAKLDRRVALKLLLSQRPENESRLAREAQAMARLSHPNVVAVFDTGVIEGKLFIAMEFVQGTTLRGFQTAQRRSVAEIVRVYLESGRGLAAAHKAGLVHRDFKPDNVLVSQDGAVKVTDFGLVRAELDDAASPLPTPSTDAALAHSLSASSHSTRADMVTGRDPASGPPPSGPSVAVSTGPADERGDSRQSGAVPSARTSGSSLDVPMTEEGAVMGTVGYMAPEQYLSEPVSAKSDQFSFSVALYDALYRQKPFAGRGLTEIAAAALAGKIEPPPKGHNVPARIHRVLLRGLRPAQDDRYPSMDALLSDLARDPRKQRFQVLGGIGAVLALGLVAGLVHRAGAAREGLCAAGEPLAREVWNDDVKKAAQTQVLGTGLAFAGDTWTRTRELLDGYMAQWAAMHAQTCRATRIEGHQPEALMAVRMACLEQRRAQVRALTQVLEHADRQTVEKAVEASRNLPSVGDCADITSLTTVKALPADPTQRAALETLGHEVGELHVQNDSGKYKDVVASAPPVVARARAAGYEPVLADALLVLGEAQDRAGKKTDATDTFRDAFYAAEAGRAEDLKVRALIALEVTLADQRKFDDARTTSRLIGAASTRLSDPDAHRADWHSANAWVACRDGKYDDSAREFREAITAAEQSADAQPVRLARMYARAGGMLGDAGRFAEGMDLLDRADATFVRVLGPDHPARVSAMVNRTATLESAGHLEEAVVTADQALELARRVLSPDSGTLANLESNRADALHALGRFDEARASAERAVAIGRTAFGPKSVTTAGFVINLGEALVGLGRYDEAVADFDDVLAVIEPALPAGHEWLGEVRAGRGEANLERGRAKDAAVDLEKALATYAAIEHKTFLARGVFAGVQAALARALVDAGDSAPHARARDLATQALATYRERHDDARSKAVTDWASKRGVALE